MASISSLAHLPNFAQPLFFHFSQVLHNLYNLGSGGGGGGGRGEEAQIRCIMRDLQVAKKRTRVLKFTNQHQTYRK